MLCALQVPRRGLTEQICIGPAELVHERCACEQSYRSPAPRCLLFSVGTWGEAQPARTLVVATAAEATLGHCFPLFFDPNFVFSLAFALGSIVLGIPSSLSSDSIFLGAGNLSSCTSGMPAACCISCRQKDMTPPKRMRTSYLFY